MVHFLRRESQFLQYGGGLLAEARWGKPVGRSFSIESQRDVDDTQVRDVRVRYPDQHLQCAELWGINEVGYRADPATGDRFDTEENLPFRSGLLLKAIL
jgi:hypothetical protein